MNKYLDELLTSLQPAEKRTRFSEQANAIKQASTPAQEHRVLKQLMKGLREMHSNDTVRSQILTRLLDAAVLKERGLYDQALRTLRKAQSMAESIQNHHLLGDVNDELRQILSRQGHLEEVRANLRGERSRWTAMGAELEAMDSSHALYQSATESGMDGGNTAQRNRLLELSATHPESMRVQYHALSAIAMLASAEGDMEARISCFQQLREFMDTHPELAASRPDIHATVLNNLCNAHLDAGRTEAIPAIIQQMHSAAEDAGYSATAHRIRFFATRQEADLLLHGEDLVEPAELDRSARHSLLGWERTLHPSLVGEFAFNMASLMFHRQRQRSCLFWLNQTDRLCAGNVRPDLQAASIGLRLMNYITDGNLELGVSLVRTRPFRILSGKDPVLPLLRTFLKLLTSRVNVTSGKQMVVTQLRTLDHESSSLLLWTDVAQWVRDVRV